MEYPMMAKSGFGIAFRTPFAIKNPAFRTKSKDSDAKDSRMLKAGWPWLSNLHQLGIKNQHFCASLVVNIHHIPIGKRHVPHSAATVQTQAACV